MSKTRDYLTQEMQRFLLSLAAEGTRVTGKEPEVICAETGEKDETADDYLDICGNLEHFWVCFGQVRFYIIVQDGPVLELISDYYMSEWAEDIYNTLKKEFGE
jgi:peptidoglycan/xylan/chitin deacetylase (PgdA/CDA1 family)